MNASLAYVLFEHAVRSANQSAAFRAVGHVIGGFTDLRISWNPTLKIGDHHSGQQF
jgi:hypothetical protein